MATILGFCLIAIILSVIAFNNAKKGKKYSVLLIVGIVLYAMAGFGNAVGNADIDSMIGTIASLILLVVMFPVCKAKQKKQ